jgi:guanylate kinase
MPYVITITGPSRAGKSKTVDYFEQFTSKGFRPELIRKYTTRDARKDDRDCIAGRDRDEIRSRCNLVYEQYGEWYGLNLQTLIDRLVEGKSPIVILNDVRAVEDVRNMFRERVRSIFIFRRDPLSPEYRQDLIKSRGQEAGEIRFEKARTIYRIYIENIHLFDHVIINSGTREELETQVKQIARSLEDQMKSESSGGQLV